MGHDPAADLRVSMMPSEDRVQEPKDEAQFQAQRIIAEWDGPPHWQALEDEIAETLRLYAVERA